MEKPFIFIYKDLDGQQNKQDDINEWLIQIYQKKKIAKINVALYVFNIAKSLIFSVKISIADKMAAFMTARSRLNIDNNNNCQPISMLEF